MRSSFETAFVVVLVAGACSCSSSRTGRIYSLTEGRPPGVIEFPAFQRPRGLVSVTLPAGSRCDGEFATVPVRVRRLDESSDRTFQQEEDVTQAGLAFLTCNDGRFLSCRLFKRIVAPDESGHGACKDDRGATYSFVL